jgi:uncharacterized protein with von Willebrand factor type A (vWA) domain
MQAALPYLDEFLPVHNLASLEDLVRAFQTASQPNLVSKRPAYA